MRNRILLVTILSIILLLLLFFCILTPKFDCNSIKNSVVKAYASKYAYFKDITLEGKLRRGSLNFSFLKDLSFLKYIPCQATAFLKNIYNRNFYFSLLGILYLLVFFSFLGIPFYFKKIPIIFLPILGFINLSSVLGCLTLLKIRYSFPTFLLSALGLSLIIIICRSLFAKNSYSCLKMKGSKDAKNFYYPAVLLIAGLFIITGHLGYLDIPRSYDHMSYSTLASLFKIEGTYPVFNIYAFPSAVYCPVPFGWVSMVAFISDLIKVSIPRAQLILVMTFFPFLGVGIYHTTKLIFNSRGWAFSAGLLALVMRMSSIAPTDGDMPEVLEWVLVSFGLFALFTFLNDKDRRYLIFSVISFVISFFLHVKLVLYTLAGLLVSIPIVLIKRNFKESRHVILIYLMFIVMITIVLLPYIISMKGGGLLGMTTLSLLEFFENMIFRHGFIMLFTVVLGIPFFARSKNPVIIFCFAYFLMFFLYFDQWILWELLKPKWYVVTLFPCINFFGAVGTYTSFFRFLSSYSQIFSAFNIILPILFIYSAYKLIPRRFIKIARIVFILFLIYESGIRPEVPVQLIGKSDLNTAQWIREETDKHTAFIANVGSDPSYLWNISGITERKCLNYRPLYFEYLEGKDPLSGIDFERLLKDNPIKAARLLKDNKFTHLLISEEAILIDCNFNEKQGFREIYKSDVDGKVSRVYKLL